MLLDQQLQATARVWHYLGFEQIRVPFSIFWREDRRKLCMCRQSSGLLLLQCSRIMARKGLAEASGTLVAV